MAKTLALIACLSSPSMEQSSPTEVGIAEWREVRSKLCKHRDRITSCDLTLTQYEVKENENGSAISRQSTTADQLRVQWAEAQFTRLDKSSYFPLVFGPSDSRSSCPSTWFVYTRSSRYQFFGPLSDEIPKSYVEVVSQAGGEDTGRLYLFATISEEDLAEFDDAAINGGLRKEVSDSSTTYFTSQQGMRARLALSNNEWSDLTEYSRWRADTLHDDRRECSQYTQLDATIRIPCFVSIISRRGYGTPVQYDVTKTSYVLENAQVNGEVALQGDSLVVFSGSTILDHRERFASLSPVEEFKYGGQRPVDVDRAIVDARAKLAQQQMQSPASSNLPPRARSTQRALGWTLLALSLITVLSIITRSRSRRSRRAPTKEIGK